MTSGAGGRRRAGRHAAAGLAPDAAGPTGATPSLDPADAAPPAGGAGTEPDWLPDGLPEETSAPAAAAFGRLVAVMDRLRSPGGCPWDADQTHESLVPYALEEVHELAEAVDAGDRQGLREELGDVLLQVVFHARVAQDDVDDPFDVAEVTDRLVAKLVRRHPHVFGDAAAGDGPSDAGALAAGDVHRRWDDAKRAEKPARASALDGVPASLGALARTQKVAGKAARAGLLALAGAAGDGARPVAGRAGAGADAPDGPAGATDGAREAADDAVPPAADPVAPQDLVDVDAAVAVVTGGAPPSGAAPDPAADAGGPHPDGGDAGAPDSTAPDAAAPDAAAPDLAQPHPVAPAAAEHDAADADATFGARLLALVLEAERDGVDAEGALRRAAAAWEVGLRAAERGGTSGDAPPWR